VLAVANMYVLKMIFNNLVRIILI